MVGLKTSCAVLTLTLVFIACYVEFTSAAGAQLVLSGTVRDQAPNTMAHNRFPADYWSYNGWTDNPTLGSCGNANNSQGWANTDFELPLYYYGTIKTPNAKGGVLYNGEVGLVGGVCNATNQWVNCGKLNPDDHTPIYAHTGPSPFGTIRSPQSFATWFHAGPTTIAVPYNLTLTQSTGRLYTYNAPFFPIDGRGWADSNQGDTNGVNHNFAFCFEIHGHFSYQGGETFSFTGDDDVWVYLDSRLMIDLGGIHTQLSATVNLDDIAGLTRGNNYRFDFFYCERHTTASDMQITTSLEIACTYYDWCDICEGTGQSCCTAQDLIECADTNACTNDSCAVLVPPQTGCQHVDITPTCPGNKCFLAGCDPAIGCTQTPVPCNDGKRCTVDTCVNSTGCVFTNYQCPGDACNVAVCSETGTMCTTTKTNCDDNNACTVDTCDPVHGCQHVALVCAQDFCHSSTCDTVAGCQNTTKNCDDSNACTKDTCDNASGCKNTQIPCGNGDKCLTFNCDPNTGCANVTKSCDDNNICTIDTCNSVTGCSNVQDPCDDGNACTIDTCSPTLGGCQHNPLPCDDHNMCTNNTCDPLSGCVYPPIVCNDNNACTNDTCIPASGCYYPPLVCSSSDKCVNATCDIVSGCQFPSISCNDQNPCTADSCDHASGCKNVPTDCNHCAYPNGSYVYCAPEGGNWCFPLSCDPNSGNCNISQPVVCNDQNACTNDTCNGADGTCSYPKITCNDNNPCTQDTCNPNSGCVFTNNTCDDNNPCTMDSCNHADGSCINTPVAGNCIACGPDPCTWTDVCNPKVCDNNVCTVQPYSCDDGNLCTNDVCDNSGVNATCHFPQKNCTAADACNPSSCDLTSGQCLTTPFDCDDANPCTDDTCSVGTDGKPVCANNRRDCPGSTACLPQVCNEDTGECEINNPPSCDDLNYCTDDNCVSITDSVWNCTHDTHDCTGFDTGNLCVLPICIPDTGCAPAASSICDDGNFCTDDECVGPLNCTHTLTSICDDNDACTNDFCDPSLAQADACSHTNLTCYPPTICQNATGCNVTTGCIFEPLVCVLNTTDFCLVPNCDLTAGCIPIPRTCLVDDPGCYQGVCDSVLGQCTQQALPDWTTITSSKGNGLSCYAYYNKGELAGIITGGAIAGIVVGAVVFAAAATVAARKAYLYAQLRAGGMGAAQANPLYTPGATEGVNPLFT